MAQKEPINFRSVVEPLPIALLTEKNNTETILQSIPSDPTTFALYCISAPSNDFHIIISMLSGSLHVRSN